MTNESFRDKRDDKRKKNRKKERKIADAACLGMRSYVDFCRELWSLFLQLRLLRLQTKIGLRASPEPGSQRASASADWGVEERQAFCRTRISRA